MRAIALARTAASLLFFGSLGAAVSCSANNSDTSGVGNGAAANGGSASSGGSGNGGSGTGGLIGTGGDAANGQGGGLQGCGADQYTGELVPVDLYILLDKSGSMSGSQDSPDIWGPVTSAVNEFLNLVSGDIRLGFGLFPVDPATPPQPNQPCASSAECGAYGPCGILGSCDGTISILGSKVGSCVSVDYTTPTVGIGALPGAATQIQAAVNSADPNGGTTPTTPALQGTMDYLKVHAQNSPDRVVLVALATDGEPSACTPNQVADAANVAAAGLSGSPSIKTFVIGLGDLGSLNTIAQAGGTGQAILVSTSNSGQEFLAALDDIRGAVTCQYQIPQPASGTPNPDLVNVGVTLPGGDQDIIPRVNGASACVGQAGWYYDNPADPSQILFCPSTCDQVEHTQGVVVDVAIGCETVVR